MANWALPVGHFAAAATVVAFGCYLRPSEALLIIAGAVTPRSQAKGSCVLTVAPATQDTPANKQQFDVEVIVGIHERAWVAELLHGPWQRHDAWAAHLRRARPSLLGAFVPSRAAWHAAGSFATLASAVWPFA